MNWRTKHIDYVFRLADIEWYFYLIAVILFLALGLIWKKWWVGGLIAYLVLVVSVTILSRTPFDGKHFQPEIFWSYRVWEQQKLQILWNVIGFIPVGIFASRLMGWKSILFAAGISLLIETVQLVSKVGLFEFDDIIHNTAGAVIGWLLFMLVRKIITTPTRA